MNWLVVRVASPLRAARRVARSSSIRRAGVAFLLFNAAEAATWIGILVYAFGQGGTTTTAIVGVVLLVPAAVAAPFVGTLGDRRPRVLIVRAGYATQSVCAIATGAAMLGGASPVIVYALAVLLMVSFTSGRPGHQSLLPELAATPEDLAAANSASSLAEGVGGSIGAIAATAVLTFAGPGAVFVAMGASLALASAVALGIRSGAARRGSERAGVRGLLGEAIEGLAAIARTPEPRLLVLFAGVFSVVWGIYEVLLVALALDVLDAGNSGVGALQTSLWVGSLAGATASFAFVTRGRLAPVLAGSTLLFGAAVVLTGWSTTLALAFVATFGVGAAFTLLDVTGVTLLQRVTDDAVLTRVLAVVESLWLWGYALGFSAAAALNDLLGLEAAFAAAGAALPLLLIATFAGMRRIDSVIQLPERQLELLLDIPMFALVARADLERIARRMERLETQPGDEVVVEGDTGDRFYVIDSGQFDVVVAGERAPTLEEGDHFGEIALLHDVLRTATVTSVGYGVVWALERDDFLRTLTGAAPQARRAAHDLSVERLERQ